jgi:hypothetical protein
VEQVKHPTSYSIFVDDGYPEADEYSNNYVERRYPANDTEEARISHVSLAPSWFERRYVSLRRYFVRISDKAAAQR